MNRFFTSILFLSLPCVLLAQEETSPSFTFVNNTGTAIVDPIIVNGTDYGGNFGISGTVPAFSSAILTASGLNYNYGDLWNAAGAVNSYVAVGGTFYYGYIPTNSCSTNLLFNGVNNSLQTVVYQVVDLVGNYSLSGAVTVSPGASFSISADNVPCSDVSQVVLYQLQIADSSSGGTNTVETPTAINPVGNGSGSGSPTDGSDGGTSYTNVLSPTNIVSQPSPVTYYPPTNSPILFSATTNPIVSQEEGDSAIFTAVGQGDVQLNSDLNSVNSNLAAVVQAVDHEVAGSSNGSGLVSNVIVENFPSNYPDGLADDTLAGISNELAGATNGVTNGLTIGQYTNYMNGFSNGVPSLSDTGFITGQVAAGTTLGGSLDSALGSISIAGVQPTVNDAGGGSETIPLAGGFSMVLSDVSIPGIARASLARTCIGAMLWLWTYVKMVKLAEKRILEMLGQHQIGGVQQMLFGNNLDTPTAIFYSAIFAAALVAVPTLLATTLSSTAGNFASLGSDFTALNSLPEWSWCTQFVPVDVIIVTFFTYYSYRFILVMPSVMVARSIMLFCVR